MASLYDDQRLTVIGLIVETMTGLERRLGRRIEDECGLSMVAFEIMLRLARTPGHSMRMSDLAGQTSLTASGLTRAVDRLVAAGWVERQTCPEDRRGQFAVLTTEGEKRTRDAVKVHLDDIQHVLFDSLTKTDVDDLERVMRKVRDLVNPEAATVPT